MINFGMNNMILVLAFSLIFIFLVIDKVRFLLNKIQKSKHDILIKERLKKEEIKKQKLELEQIEQEHIKEEELRVQKLKEYHEELYSKTKNPIIVKDKVLYSNSERNYIQIEYVNITELDVSVVEFGVTVLNDFNDSMYYFKLSKKQNAEYNNTIMMSEIISKEIPYPLNFGDSLLLNVPGEKDDTLYNRVNILCEVTRVMYKDGKIWGLFKN